MVRSLASVTERKIRRGAVLGLIVLAWAPGRATPAVDCFGTRELYPSKPNGETWCLADDPARDARTRPPALTANGDGSFKVRSTQVRWDVYTSAGFHPDQVATDQQVLTERKYMQSARDWKNVEVTLYVRVNSFSSSTVNGAAHLELEGRSGRHTGWRPAQLRRHAHDGDRLGRSHGSHDCPQPWAGVFRF